MRALVLSATAALASSCTTADDGGGADCGGPKCDVLDESADLVLFNGSIHTQDAKQATATSIAIKDDQIVYLGDDKGAASYIGSSTRAVDLGGKMVLPGFVDSHMHPVMTAYSQKYRAWLDDSYTVADIESVLQTFVADHPDDAFIEGLGYYRNYYITETGDEQQPTKETLDAIESVRPTVIYEASGHSAWVNSAALELAGITSATPDPVGGVIERDSNGEPTGQLLENAMYLVIDHFPLPEIDKIKTAFRENQAYFAQQGLTTVFDAGAGYADREQEVLFQAMDELAEAGELTLRYRAAWQIFSQFDPTAQIDEFIARSANYTHPNFQTTSVKFYIDGIIEERTGLLLEPYCDGIAPIAAACTGSSFGLDLWKGVDLVAALHKVDQAGMQIHAHVIGDGAVRKMLDSLEAAQVPASSKPALAHIQMAAPEDVVRMGQMGVSAAMTAQWMGLDDYFTAYYYPNLGFERAYGSTYPYKSLFDAGVLVTNGSDWWISVPDMPFAIFTGMTRMYPQRIYDAWYGDTDAFPYYTDLDHTFVAADFDPVDYSASPIGPLPPADERVSLEQMLDAVTINGARAYNLDDETGSLEVGKSADLVVMDSDLFDAEASGELETIADSKVLMTVFEGKVVYDEGVLP
jgi:predicted amidohydrolase YtcJ